MVPRGQIPWLREDPSFPPRDSDAVRFRLRGFVLTYVVGSLFECPTVGIPGSRQQPYDEGPKKAQGGQRAAQVSRR